MEYVCKHCGAPDLYETGSVVEDASREIEITLRDGKLVAIPDDLSVESDRFLSSSFEPDGYACAACQQTAGRIEDIAVPETGDDLNAGCCCGHGSGSHRAPNEYGRRSCTETLCGCWDYETDPTLATVVRERAAA